MNNIRKLIDKTYKNKSNKQIKLNLSIVRKSVAERAKEKTGIDISGYKFVIDNFAIIHTFQNHGNENKEKIRNQIAVTSEYLELIPQILKYPDKISDGGINKIGRQVIIFEKLIENNIIYVQECRTKKKELAMQTMYIKKAT